MIHPFTFGLDSAHCFIQPILVNSAVFGRVSLNQVKAAATRILDECAFDPGYGGIAKNIGVMYRQNTCSDYTDTESVGGDGNVAVVLSKFEPSVTCRGLNPDWFSCNAIMYKMDASNEPLYFGPLSDPRSQVGLPALITAG